jgi:hypothetical protein
MVTVSASRSAPRATAKSGEDKTSVLTAPSTDDIFGATHTGLEDITVVKRGRQALSEASLTRAMARVHERLCQTESGKHISVQLGRRMHEWPDMLRRPALEESLYDLDGERLNGGRRVRVQEILGRHRIREPNLEYALSRQFKEIEDRLKAGRLVRIAIRSEDVITRFSMRELRRLSREYGGRLDIRVAGPALAQKTLKSRFAEVKAQVRLEEKGLGGGPPPVVLPMRQFEGPPSGGISVPLPGTSNHNVLEQQRGGIIRSAWAAISKLKFW